MKCLFLQTILTAYVLAPIRAADESNSSLSKHGSHYLFKLDGTGKDGPESKRNSRCTPCGSDPAQRQMTNYLDPEYRGNGADNLGYDWSPRAWGGPAFSQRMKNFGMPFQSQPWDRERGGRQMAGNWIQKGSETAFNCNHCRMLWEQERGSRMNRFNDNNFSNRMGRWQDDRNRYQGEVATVTSPPIALRPEGRIAYVPSPGGEMYWDGISGGGTRWDGFSNGISWLGGGTGRYNDGSWRGDPRGYDNGPKGPDDYRDNKGGNNYYRPWSNELNRGPPSWPYPGKNYGNYGPNMNFDMRYNGYASKWHYGTTNQNGWNGNNMKWNYGGKGWDNRDGHNYYGSPGGKFEEDGNPLPGGGPYHHGSGGGKGGSYSHGPGSSSPYGQTGSLGNGYPYNHGGGSPLYGQGGTIQYGYGGSVYYDQGTYIYHYGQGTGGTRYPTSDSSKYPQDGPQPSYPVGRPVYNPDPSRPPSNQKPWDYNSNDRYDNREPSYSNSNWIRPGPTYPGYPKPDSHGKYPSGGYDDKNRKPWSVRPSSGNFGPGRPDLGSGHPHDGAGYITVGVPQGGDRYPGSGGRDPFDNYGSNRPVGFPSYGGPNGGNEYQGGFGGYPRPSGSIGPEGNGGYGQSRPGGGSWYPGPSGSNGYRKPDHGSGGPGGFERPGGPDRPHPGSEGYGYPTSPGRPVDGGYGTSIGPSRPGGSGYGGPERPGGVGYVQPLGPGRPGGSGYVNPGNLERPGGGGYRPSTVSGRPGTGGYIHPDSPDRPGLGPGVPDRPGGIGYGHEGPTGGGYGQPYGHGSKPPPKGYYSGFITEIDESRFPNGVHIGQPGSRYPPGGSYPVGDRQPGYGDGNRYAGDRYPVGSGGDGYQGNGVHPYGHGDYNDRDHYHPSSSTGELDKGPNVNEEGNSWNYGQDGHKDGIYRRAGGSYPPYRGGPYYTSSYLASASTPAGASQAPSEGKTPSVTKVDEVTKPTSETA